ncbi:ATP-dependent helicase [Thermocoleostomius sinensis]|uniref:DNA 3'-5' helicase n=1 Tax=Thermocoleostomius sinensis A174 TaxID=2016057 RepID=A0A9E9C9W1_9CYAN|nr:ATP-dependent helicase [Thermocoleostomius sinensis]WAL58175.1 ATP-dependent helicase [Thermocoleostomius sinensis A174]
MSINLIQVTAAQRAQILQQMRSRLRPGQQRMADWQAGPLAISAVPGSGKSTGMAIAVAILLATRSLGSQDSGIEIGQKTENKEQEIGLGQEEFTPNSQLLLVTFTRSAVANLKSKIREHLRSLSIASQGFMVYTLHGLALNIATRHPDLSGLDLNRLTLVSPNQSSRLIRTCVEQWVAAHPQSYQRLLEGRQFDGEETERLRRQSVLRTEVLPDLAYTVIHEAKSSGLLPQQLYELGKNVTRHAILDEADYDVLTIAAGLYERYQTLLRQRGFLDYDDMILAALRVLENSSARQLWQSQIYAVFEDEAQDSSPLQTRLLEILATAPNQADRLPNLVRVGDPNQAINSTFTPADPAFFYEFCERCALTHRLAEMDQAGRSTQAIIDAANFVLTWVNDRYANLQPPIPNPQSPILPFRPQYIHPVAPDDPQEDANPDPEGTGLEIRFPPDIYQTVNLIGLRVAELLTHYPDRRAAVLVRENRQGRFIADLLQNPDFYHLDINLKQSGIELYDVGQRDRHSHVPAEILTMLQFLDRPHSPDYLKAALQVLVDRQLIPTQDLNALVSFPEQFLYPGPLDPPQPDPVRRARRYCVSLLKARLELPHYQLIPFLAMTLQYEQSELATADKLAERIIHQTFGDSSMATVLDALGEIVRSERFEAVEMEEPESRLLRPRQLTLITMHKAKGLDWDFVFIPFLHEQVIPGRLRVLPQAQFLGDFTLSEVARAQIRASIHGMYPLPDLLSAWQRAESLKIAEEFRLLYVAMTRAKRLLWMSAAHKAPFSWSKPENLDDRAPCPVLPALVHQFPQSMSHPSKLN